MFPRVASEIAASGGRVAFVKANVTVAEDWKKILEVAKTHLGGADILVNNAGWTYRLKDSLEVTTAEYDRKNIYSLRTNLKGSPSF